MMSKTQDFAGHTPGPWSIDKWSQVVDTNGRTIRAVGLALACGTINEDDPATTNARLIAAAPSLLADRDALAAENRRLRAALEALVNSSDYGWRGDKEDDRPLMVAARAALVATNKGG